MAIATLLSSPAEASSRELNLYFTHTNERLTIVYKRGGRYIPSAINELNRFLRDWRRNESTKIDPELFDLLWHVYRDVGAKKPIHIVSAYRSPATNNMLRRRSRGVARFSQHTVGKAIDFYIPGVSSAKIREAAFKRQVGGVGFYPRSGTPFVHLDTGSVRAWPRMSRKQLTRLFPDGKTLHLPSDGKPLANYEAAKAAEAAGRLAKLDGGGGGGGGLLAFARGGGNGRQAGADRDPNRGVIRPGSGGGGEVVTALLNRQDGTDINAALERAGSRPQPAEPERAADGDEDEDGPRLLPAIGGLVDRITPGGNRAEDGDDDGALEAQPTPPQPSPGTVVASLSEPTGVVSALPRPRPVPQGTGEAETADDEVASDGDGTATPPVPRVAPSRYYPDETPSGEAQNVTVAALDEGEAAGAAFGYADPLAAPSASSGADPALTTAASQAAVRAQLAAKLAERAPATPEQLPAARLIAAPDDSDGRLLSSAPVEGFGFATFSHPDRNGTVGEATLALSVAVVGEPEQFTGSGRAFAYARNRFERPSIVIFARRP